MSQLSTDAQPSAHSNNTTAHNAATNAYINDPKREYSSRAVGADGSIPGPDTEVTPEQAQSEGLPEQRHAGAVGYGPSYATKDKVTISEKITGVKEQLVGKLTNNPELVQKGHERQTGELKKRERDQHETDPFGIPENQETTQGHDDHVTNGKASAEPVKSHVDASKR